MDFFRETQLGQVIRWVTNNRVLLYPEERPDFKVPPAYLHTEKKDVIEKIHDDEPTEQHINDEEFPREEAESEDSLESVEKTSSLDDSAALSRITTRQAM